MVNEKTCKVPSCIREVKARGLCGSHHIRMLRYFKENQTENEEEFITYAYQRDTRSPYCSVTYCKRPVHGKGLCHSHYHLYYYHLKRENVVGIDDYLKMQEIDCYVPACESKVVAKGFCRKHYNKYNSNIKKARIHSKEEFLNLLEQEEKQKTKVCRVMKCSRKTVARSLCKRHYQRFLRHDVERVEDYLKIERMNQA